MRFLAQRHVGQFLFLTVLWAALLLLPAARAQDTPPANPTEITAGFLDGRIATIQESPTLDEAAKAQIIQLYTQSQEQLRAAEEWRATANQFEELRLSAPERMKVRQEELENTLSTPSDEERVALDDADALSLAEMEIKVAEVESMLSAAQASASEQEQESARRSERRRQLPGLQTEARARLDAAKAQMTAAPVAAEGPELTEARRVLNLTKIQMSEQEIRAYTEEANSYDARGRLLALRLDLAARNLQRAKTLADEWRDHLATKRQDEARLAEVAAREAMLEASNAPIQIRELVQNLAAENLELTQSRTGSDGLPKKIEQSAARLKQYETTLARLETDGTTLKNKVEAAGSRSVVGLLLHSHRRSLPDVKSIEKEIAKRQDEIASIQISQIELEESRRELVSISAVVTEVLEGLPTNLSDQQRTTISEILRQHYQTKRDLLYEKSRDYEDYFNELLKLDALQNQLIERIQVLDNYIGERVLWVRSGSTIGFGHLVEAQETLRWLVKSDQVDGIVEPLWLDIQTYPVPLGLSILALVLLFAARRPLRRRLRVCAEQATKRGNTQIKPTLVAAVHTFLLSLDVPLLFGLVGWRLSASISGNDYTSAAGNGLIKTALVLWSIDFAREVLKRNGLGEAHFEWSSTACQRIYRTLLWLEILAFPLVLIVSRLSELGDSIRELSLGRLCFMSTMVLVTVATHQLLRKRKGALFDLIDIARGRSSLYMRRIGYAIGIGAPMILFAAAGLGYYYSAVHIAAQLHMTLVGTFCLIIAMQLIVCWMTMTRKSIAREQARKRRDALRGAALSESDAGVEMEKEIDLARVDAQTMRLVKSAFVIAMAAVVYVIWSSDLPALSVLDQVELWKTVDTIQHEIPTPDSEEVTFKTDQIIVPITLRNVAFFLFISVITFIAVQNLPGLLEIVLLQRLSLIAGERYAINSIMGYVLTIAGATWAFSTIGLSWGKIQWLVAAVGLGLGFGLQEIFANMVSGLIILFERPIRVGDTVTVGEISGTVSQIRIRATWITAFNRQELIVPNKEFVTGRLVNWTLSDEVLRVEIPVGIAYGSDTALARRLMLDVAKANELVLEDPAPVVFFKGFGDSSLDFELRVHSPDLESFLPIKDAMLTGIDGAFREHGIEIPFPQRDIHVRTVDGPIPMDVRRNDGSTSGE